MSTVAGPNLSAFPDDMVITVEEQGEIGVIRFEDASGKLRTFRVKNLRLEDPKNRSTNPSDWKKINLSDERARDEIAQAVQELVHHLRHQEFRPGRTFTIYFTRTQNSHGFLKTAWSSLTKQPLETFRYESFNVRTNDQTIAIDVESLQLPDEATKKTAGQALLQFAHTVTHGLDTQSKQKPQKNKTKPKDLPSRSSSPSLSVSVPPSPRLEPDTPRFLSQPASPVSSPTPPPSALLPPSLLPKQPTNYSLAGLGPSAPPPSRQHPWSQMQTARISQYDPTDSATRTRMVNGHSKIIRVSDTACTVIAAEFIYNYLSPDGLAVSINNLSRMITQGQAKYCDIMAAAMAAGQVQRECYLGGHDVVGNRHFPEFTLVRPDSPPPSNVSKGDFKKALDQMAASSQEKNKAIGAILVHAGKSYAITVDDEGRFILFDSHGSHLVPDAQDKAYALLFDNAERAASFLERLCPILPDAIIGSSISSEDAVGLALRRTEFAITYLERNN